MTRLRSSRNYAITALTMFWIGASCNSIASAQEDPPAKVDGVEVLVRGPVHEAFAETVLFNPEAGVVVAKTPPDSINELVPDQRPDGKHVAWIPGYWAWDDDRSDYLWVSGIWRAAPPGRQWIPGTWIQVEGGFQWTAGYWADADLIENEYLTEPPETLENGPTQAAASENDIWLPGSWLWKQSRYEWRPGYWATAQQDWMWVPAQYIWSPSGYIFVDGYYDYSLARRGVLFAPVYFSPNVVAQQGFAYTPAMAINLAVFGSQLFLRPGYNHYYFGDYFGSRDAHAGYAPWHTFNSSGHGYDPFYAHQLWQNRKDPTWAKTVQTDFQHRVDHEGTRPPRTLADQQALLKSGEASRGNQIVAATSLDALAKAKESPLKLQPVTKDEHQTFTQHGQGVHELRESRQKVAAKTAEKPAEKSVKTAETAVKKNEPVKGEKSTKEVEAVKTSKSAIDSPSAVAKTFKSPIVAKKSDQLSAEHTPPKPHVVPQSDPKIEPKQRQSVAKPALPSERTNPAASGVKNNQTPQPPKPGSGNVAPKDKAKK